MQLYVFRAVFFANFHKISNNLSAFIINIVDKAG